MQTKIVYCFDECNDMSILSTSVISSLKTQAEKTFAHFCPNCFKLHLPSLHRLETEALSIIFNNRWQQCSSPDFLHTAADDLTDLT